MASRIATRGNGQVTLPKPAVASKLPTPLQFPLVVLISFSASYFLFSAASAFTGMELSTVSRRIENPLEILAFPAWRVVELAVAWFLRFDDYDMAALTLQTQLPYYFLLTSFHGISLSTTSIYLLLDVFCASLPFFMMRRRLPAHSGANIAQPNHNIILSWGIFLLTTIFSASIYSLFIYASFKSWLPVHMVTYFDNITSLHAAHDTQLLTLGLTFLPLGWAARTFLFSPSTAARMGLSDMVATSFNPHTATLGDTFRHNVWGWSKGTKVVIKRSATLAILVGVTTWLRVWKTVDGSEGLGAAGWAGLWSLASLVNGAALRWVGNV